MCFLNSEEKIILHNNLETGMGPLWMGFSSSFLGEEKIFLRNNLETGMGLPRNGISVSTVSAGKLAAYNGNF